MPPVSKKDCGLVLFDVGSPKKAELLNGLLKFATFKWFMNSRSIYRLILMNSDKTQNDKNYPNIYTTDMDDFDPKLVFKEINSMEAGKSSWLDALRLGIYHLQEALELRGLVTLQLIFFTTLDSNNTPVFDLEVIKQIIESINQYEIYLYIIGPNVNLPFPITNQNLVAKCMNELYVDQSQKNLLMARKIVTGTKNSVMCNTKIGAPHLLLTYKNSQGSQPWKIPFTFGTKLSIPSVTTKIFRKDISLKLFTSTPRSYVKTLAEHRDVKVEESEIVKGVVRHGKFLKMDDAQFRVETERCFEIMGFTHKKFVPETYLRGEDTFYVMPNESTNDGFQIFTHLVKILHESGMYAIGKRVYAPNNKVRYFVLIPKIDYKPKCFVMTGMPYAGFLVPHKCETPIQPKEKLRQDDFNRFFRSLMIDNKDSKAGISLGPTMMMDVHQQKIVNATAKKFLRREDLDMDGLDIRDHETVVDNKFLENFRSTWPVRSSELATAKRN